MIDLAQNPTIASELTHFSLIIHSGRDPSRRLAAHNACALNGTCSSVRRGRLGCITTQPTYSRTSRSRVDPLPFCCTAEPSRYLLYHSGEDILSLSESRVDLRRIADARHSGVGSSAALAVCELRYGADKLACHHSELHGVLAAAGDEVLLALKIGRDYDDDVVVLRLQVVDDAARGVGDIPGTFAATRVISPTFFAPFIMSAVFAAAIFAFSDSISWSADLSSSVT